MCRPYVNRQDKSCYYYRNLKKTKQNIIANTLDLCLLVLLHYLLILLVKAKI